VPLSPAVKATRGRAAVRLDVVVRQTVVAEPLQLRRHRLVLPRPRATAPAPTAMGLSEALHVGHRGEPRRMRDDGGRASNRSGAHVGCTDDGGPLVGCARSIHETSVPTVLPPRATAPVATEGTTALPRPAGAGVGGRDSLEEPSESVKHTRPPERPDGGDQGAALGLRVEPEAKPCAAAGAGDENSICFARLRQYVVSLTS
jgi:hypothetical protein